MSTRRCLGRTAVPDAQLSVSGLSVRIAKEVKRQLPPWRGGRSTYGSGLASITDEVMEQILESFGIPGTSTLDSSPVLASLAGKVASLELDLQVISGEVEPTFKQCPGGLMHRALPRGTSPCGWPWRRKPGRQVSVSEWEPACLEPDKVCTSCR